ncbi:putative Nucleoside-diphosphate-sugar epimerase [Vibrio nigripulchritudo MADA3029]|uniref:NAD(P)H-binding protein n=1 Tax=Vibrio nigripulchritudo TaxID=28173 RepID=UPI0003B23C2E|nr:NAD(P)H-binding protein [Vibrio nigripulchritudo]CCN47713.1 putative Nucleoside-diphosphate-sugar epimerase [Vibrio nigripulchritudo MADA3020]CCN53052.1 putative Nucleoside-diphosphate-sugar epimerase [Vibrio nigripulchritudo MADA3021]CCN61512.1 putative Nucleoside-diphosphate-sugar epimerase [Vibrio nigripulchritudo MADA3029]
MSRIVVVGAGWLGLPLAKHLISNDHQVVATKTSQQGIDQLSAQSIEGVAFSFSERLEENINRLTQIFTSHQADIVVGAFPPGFRKGNGEQYALHWQAMSEAANKAGVKKIVKVSSTTVYPEQSLDMTEEKASLSIAIENKEFSDKAVIMLKAEQAIIDSGLDYVVVRCSGLVGSDRHPSRFAGRLKSVSKSAPANMLHQDDAVGVVAFAVTNLHNTVVNATSPSTVSKAEYYQRAIEAIDSDEECTLPPVVDQPGKRIVSDKLVSLGYSFLYPSTLDAL